MKAERRMRGEKGSMNAIKIHYTHVWSYNEHLVLERKFYLINVLLVVTWKNKFSVQRDLSWIADFKIVWSKTVPRQNVFELTSNWARQLLEYFKAFALLAVKEAHCSGKEFQTRALLSSSTSSEEKSSFLWKHSWRALHVHCHQGSMPCELMG